MTDINKLLDQRRAAFIAARRDIELYIQNFFAELDKVNPSLLENTHPVTGRTAQEIFPSLYAEPFDEEKYNQEYEIFDAYFQEVKSVADYLNAKAEEVLNSADNC